MKEITPNLYIGNQEDFEYTKFPKDEWSHLMAAKEPWHRQALGYDGRSASKDHPEYLIARRGNCLVLNLVDAPKPIFFSKDLIDEGLKFVKEELAKGRKVGVFCNKGESRSASIVLLYLVKHGLIEGNTLEDVEAEFMKIYPDYNPGAGMRGFVKENFEKYRNGL